MPEELRAKLESADRLARIEEKIDQLKNAFDLVTGYGERLALAERESKVNKEKNDEQENKLAKVGEKFEKVKEEIENKVDKSKKEIYWIAGIIVAAINFVLFLLEKAGGAK